MQRKGARAGQAASSRESVHPASPGLTPGPRGTPSMAGTGLSAATGTTTHPPPRPPLTASPGSPSGLTARSAQPGTEDGTPASERSCESRTWFLGGGPAGQQSRTNLVFPSHKRPCG